MRTGWGLRVTLIQSLNNQTREYTNIQILKKALFSMFPSYSIARLHGRNAENFQVMQVSCKLYNWKDNSYAESCIYKTLNILWERLSKTWQTLDNVLYYVCPAWLKQIPLNKFWKKLKKTLDKYSEFGILIMWVRERREILLCQWRQWTSHRLAFCKSAYTKAWGVTDKIITF